MSYLVKYQVFYLIDELEEMNVLINYFFGCPAAHGGPNFQYCTTGTGQHPGGEATGGGTFQTPGGDGFWLAPGGGGVVFGSHPGGGGGVPIQPDTSRTCMCLLAKTNRCASRSSSSANCIGKERKRNI
jgi:hypothetical protein